MKKKQTAISLLLVLCIVLSMVPVQVFAEEDQVGCTTTETIVAAVTTEETIAVEETITMDAISIAEETTVTEEALLTDENTVCQAVEIEEAVNAVTTVNGTCGENLSWSLENGVLTISGTGDMDNYLGFGYTSNKQPWKDMAYNGIHSVVIAPGVTSIGNNAFASCKKLSDVSIPDTVTKIGRYAFEDCTMLTSLQIPTGVTSIGYSAFLGCGITRITIPEGITRIESYTFSECRKLEEIHLPDTLSCIEKSAFQSCKKLTNITLPASLRTIGGYAFQDSGITAIALPEGMTRIEKYAFYECDKMMQIALPRTLQYVEEDAFLLCEDLEDVYYNGTKEQWEQVKIETGSGLSEGMSNIDLRSATIHCLDVALNLGNLAIEKVYSNFYLFRGDPHIYNMDSPSSANYAELSTIAKLAGGGSADDIIWSSSDENILTISITGALIPDFVGLMPGTATVTAANSNGESVSFHVSVLRPNTLLLTSVHGTKQFYAGGGFYSEKSGFSDSVEIYLRLDNRKLSNYPCKPTDPGDSSVSIAPITITAEVSGTDLSFDREKYQNTYKAVYDPIAFEASLADLLMLYPVNPDTLVSGSSYTVNITMKSAGFQVPITDSYSFTILDAAQERVNEHIEFITGDNAYLVSKGNHYGQNMAELKKDPEYFFSKLYSLDFENYYEVVIADILMEALDYQIDNGFSIMPKVLKEWGKNFKVISSSIDKIMDEELGEDFGIGETKIEKLLKLNKYEKTTNYAEIDDAAYQLAIAFFGNSKNMGKITDAFAVIDRTGKVFDLISVGTDILKEVYALGGTICLMNAFKEADEELKQVLVTVSGMIPANADDKLLEALQDYINYDHDVRGQAAEIFESFLKTTQKVTFETLENFWSISAGEYIGGKLLGFIGKISIDGGASTLISTAQYPAVSSAFGTISTGVSIGVSLSDILCDTSGKATEMGKIIAMSDYAPYFIEALEIYEDRMVDWQTEASVDLFETAFRLHKAVQLYIMDHVYDLLVLKGESLIQIFWGNAEYFEVAADVLAHQRNVQWMNCCDAVDMSSHTLIQTRIIAICCPVDAYVYDEAGNEVVRILRDQLEYAANGISVYIRDREKFIAVPAGREYSVKIIATDAGTMDYLVVEYNENMERQRTVKQEDIPLVTNRVFTGTVPKNKDDSQDNYHLTVRNQCENGHQFVEGVCTVCGSRLPGDVDRDGNVSETDAIYLIWHTLFPSEYPLEQSLADFNGDGEVTSTDAVELLWYALNLESMTQ